jgi:hypothetical protein
LLLAGAVFQVGWPAITTAQELPAGVLACSAEKDDARRLSCFDREVARLSAPAADVPAIAAAPNAAAASVPPVAAAVSTASASVPVAARAPEPASSAENSFGFPGGSAPAKREQQEAQAASLKQLQATVTKLARRGYGEFVITLDNGQVWAQLAADADSSFDLKVQDKVTIKRAALGSYLMSSPSGRSTRVSRLR